MRDDRLPIGTNKCKCSSCGKYFNSAAAFDKHRVGLYVFKERRCLTTQEMQDIGMDLNKAEYWITEKMAPRDFGNDETATI